MSATAAVKPIRKFPPLCWSQEEALALIGAYRERWYALRRGYLRTPDWDSVADQVGTACPGAVPAKTSAQCRHKMEKLRQRYRAEKQRAQSFPGRFFSSWFYFEAMDAMEHGSGGGEVGDPVKSMLKVVNLRKNDVVGSIPNHNFDQVGLNLNPGRGIRFKPTGDRDRDRSLANSVRAKILSKNSNFGSRVANLDYLDDGYEEDEDDGGGEEGGEFVDGFLLETPNSRYPPRFQSDNCGGDGSGVRGKGSSLRPRKLSKIEKVNPNFWDDGSNVNNQVDADGEVWVKVPRDRNSSAARGFNGYPSAGRKSGGGGIKKENVAVLDMVSSIKLLGDGFMKMEKMKMEMASEIEKMRMETEMKRNELIIESQKQIVDAFVKGIVESKKRKQKQAVVATES